MSVMSERDRHKLRGPVHTMRTETAEWDDATESWKEPRGYTFFTFRTDGNASDTEVHVGEQTSHTLYQYDSAGRLTEVQSWVDAGPKARTQFRYDASGRPAETVSVDADGKQRQAETYSYDADGRRTKVQFSPTISLRDDDGGDESTSWHTFIPSGPSDPPEHARLATILYDAGNRPMEVLVHTASYELYRVTFTRDRDGRLLTGETKFAGPKVLASGLEESLEKATPEERAQMQTLLETAFEKQTFMSVSFSYDRDGRLLERVRRMGAIWEMVDTFRYDEHGNDVEQTTTHRGRDLGVDEQGAVRSTPDEVNEQHGRAEYRYDAQDNWTERVRSQRSGARDYARSTIERRRFTYY
jgi:hypothetical protein